MAAPTLLSLPRELRDMIYEYLLPPRFIEVHTSDEPTKQHNPREMQRHPKYPHSYLASTCHQLHAEICPEFYSRTTFAFDISTGAGEFQKNLGSRELNISRWTYHLKPTEIHYIRHAELNIQLPRLGKGYHVLGQEWKSFFQGNTFQYNSGKGWLNRWHRRGFEALETVTIRFTSHGSKRYNNPWSYNRGCLDRKDDDFTHELFLKEIVETLAYYLPPQTRLRALECWGRRCRPVAGKHVCEELYNSTATNLILNGEFDFDRINELTGSRIDICIRQAVQKGDHKRYRLDKTPPLSGWDWKYHKAHMNYLARSNEAKHIQRHAESGFAGLGSNWSSFERVVWWPNKDNVLDCYCKEKYGTVKVTHDLVKAWDDFRNPSDWRQQTHVALWEERHDCQARKSEDCMESELRQSANDRENYWRKTQELGWLRRREEDWYVDMDSALQNKLHRAVTTVFEREEVEGLHRELWYWPDPHPAKAENEKRVNKILEYLERSKPWYKVDLFSALSRLPALFSKEEIAFSREELDRKTKQMETLKAWLDTQAPEYLQKKKDRLDFLVQTNALMNATAEEEHGLNLVDLEWARQAKTTNLGLVIRDGLVIEERLDDKDWPSLMDRSTVAVLDSSSNKGFNKSAERSRKSWANLVRSTKS